MKNYLLTYAGHFKQLYRQLFQTAAQVYGLTQLEIDILLFLYNNPEYNTAGNICEIRGIAKSNVSNAVEALRQKGYLDIVPQERNRRVKRLLLAEEREPVLRELAACQEECFQILLRGFEEEECRMFRDFLQRTDENVMDYLKNEKQDK